MHGVGGFVLKFASELDLAHFYAVLHGTRILVFPDDEVAAFNCALALLLRHSLVDLYRCHMVPLELFLPEKIESRISRISRITVIPWMLVVSGVRPKFQKLEVVLWQFDRLVEGFLPKVHAALTRRGWAVLKHWT